MTPEQEKDYFDSLCLPLMRNGLNVDVASWLANLGVDVRKLNERLDAIAERMEVKEDESLPDRS